MGFNSGFKGLSYTNGPTHNGYRTINFDIADKRGFYKIHILCCYIDWLTRFFYEINILGFRFKLQNMHIQPFKDEEQTAVFKDTGRTAL